MLSEATRAWLLFVARKALADALGVGYEPVVEPLRPADAALDRPASAFVSWHEGERLVGCIGTLAKRLPLEATVRTYAVESGLNDPRTRSATVADLPKIRCEISVLSDPAPMSVTGLDAIRDALVPGRDGLVIHEGSRRAVFLPVVWDQLPDPEAFVTHLCRKAGLDRKRDAARITGETFTAEKWSEQ